MVLWTKMKSVNASSYGWAFTLFYADRYFWKLIVIFLLTD